MPVLQFKGKTAVENYHHTVPHHRLDFDAKLSLLGQGEKPSLDGNLIIEGDNLLALKALLPTHAGKVKCIYIDPPYNTGDEGWVYNDNLTQPQFKEWIGRTVGKEGEDACRHDKWCAMMYPRLEILKLLLHDDGVIFVSIDDIEHHSLRFMMDKIFGAENFIASFVWKSRLNRDNRNVTGASIDHEYVVCYGAGIRGTDRDATQYTNPDGDKRGDWTSANMVGLATKKRRPNLHFDLIDPTTGINYGCPPMGWRYDPKTMARLINENRILWPPRRSGRPRRKKFLAELKTTRTGFSSIVGEGLYTRDGTAEIVSIFGEPIFAFPKPVQLLIELFEQGTGEDSIILDCCAGSGTTAHAVLALNHSESTHRRFVVIQQPYDSKEQEKQTLNVCRTITRKRIEAVASGYVDKSPGSIEKESIAALGGTFTYARVGEPLFSEYRDFGKKLPDWETLARYVFYTETGRDCDSKKMKPKTGFIGSTEAAGGTSYYLHYSPDNEENQRVSLRTLPGIVEKDKSKNLVIYAERVWLHGDELAKFEKEHNRKIRPMVIPFGLK